MLSVVKMLLKGEVGGCALNSHGNCIVDHGKIMELCWNPEERVKWLLLMPSLLAVLYFQNVIPGILSPPLRLWLLLPDMDTLHRFIKSK